jgi:GxxExxY protein
MTRVFREVEMDDVLKLCDEVRQVAYAIHVYLGPAHFERVYENALAHRLLKLGIKVKQQSPVIVADEDGTLLGNYFADLLIADSLIVEVKAASTLATVHEAQLLGYLRASKIEHGLLINFGSYRFQIRKFIRSQKEPVEDSFETGK